PLPAGGLRQRGPGGVLHRARRRGPTADRAGRAGWGGRGARGRPTPGGRGGRDGAAGPPGAGRPGAAWRESWLPRLQAARAEAVAADGALLASGADPVHPLRIYGELARLLDEDAVVIGDGGDFVSYAGKYLEPRRPGGWLDPGPYGCLGTGLGY